MRGICQLLLPFLALVAPASAGIAVHESGGRVDVAAAAAPLADVLDRLARQTGMKIVYEGPAPRQLVTLALVGRSPAEAVTAILEGQGLNYALILDATATRVEKLLVTGASAGGSGSTAARVVAPRRIEARRVPREPEPEPEPDEPPEEDSPPAVPTAPEAGQPQPNAPGSPNAPALPPGMSAPPGMPAVPPGTPALPPGLVAVPPGFPTPPPPPMSPGLTPVVPTPQPTPTPPPAAPP